MTEVLGILAAASVAALLYAGARRQRWLSQPLPARWVGSGALAMSVLSIGLLHQRLGLAESFYLMFIVAMLVLSALPFITALIVRPESSP